MSNSSLPVVQAARAAFRGLQYLLHRDPETYISLRCCFLAFFHSTFQVETQIFSKVANARGGSTPLQITVQGTLGFLIQLEALTILMDGEWFARPAAWMPLLMVVATRNGNGRVDFEGCGGTVKAFKTD